MDNQNKRGLLNPYIWPIEGDLSRADVVVLTQLCRGKDVIEFGIGGSTILLSQVANKVITYEHDKEWIQKIEPKLNDKVEIRVIEKKVNRLKGIAESCDVFVNDGHSLFRAPALLEFWPLIKNCAILHDSRMTYAGNCVKSFIDAFIIKNNPSKYNPGLPDNPFTGSLESIYWNYLESNMVVMNKRNCTLTYENWKLSERIDNAEDKIVDASPTGELGRQDGSSYW